MISILSVVFAACAGTCLFLQVHFANTTCIALLLGAAACTQLRLLCNLFDGMVAVEGGKASRTGDIPAAVVLMGFAGGLTMSAIKRDRGVRDYGTLLAGHGGMLDRIDSLCFAAPVFFHLVRYFYAG